MNYEEEANGHDKDRPIYGLTDLLHPEAVENLRRCPDQGIRRPVEPKAPDLAGGEGEIRVPERY